MNQEIMNLFNPTTPAQVSTRSGFQSRLRRNSVVVLREIKKRRPSLPAPSSPSVTPVLRRIFGPIKTMSACAASKAHEVQGHHLRKVLVE